MCPWLLGMDIPILGGDASIQLQLAPALGVYLLATKLAGCLYDREAGRQGSARHCTGSACFRCLMSASVHTLGWSKELMAIDLCDCPAQAGVPYLLRPLPAGRAGVACAAPADAQAVPCRQASVAIAVEQVIIMQGCVRPQRHSKPGRCSHGIEL
jgi:hypothetical protein